MLALENLTVSYGHHPVLSGLSLSVAAGEVRVVLGPNGAGKSTLLKSIMGLVPFVAGKITGPGGTPLGGLKTNRIARHGVAYVPEGRGMLNSLTVKENLQVGATTLTDSDKASRFDYVLGLFPILGDKLAQPAGLLSGGQQQMLAIGRALISSPKVLLLDEPSLGLAPLIRREIAELLADVVRTERLAVIMVEQDVSLAERCGTSIHVLRRGQLSEAFAPEMLKDREHLSRLYLGAVADAATQPEVSA